MRTNFAHVHALACCVFSLFVPQPGGPKNRHPREGFCPYLRKISGCSKGHCTISMSCFFTSSSPPISAHLTLGTSTTVDRRDDGLTILRDSVKCDWLTAMAARISASITSSSTSMMSICSRMHANAASVHSCDKEEEKKERKRKKNEKTNKKNKKNEPAERGGRAHWGRVKGSEIFAPVSSLNCHRGSHRDLQDADGGRK